MIKSMYVNKKIKTAIIDPVGIKAGMDLYDLNLANALRAEKADAIIISNFDSKELFVYRTFNKECKSFFSKAKDILIGHLRALYLIKKRRIKSVIIHSFSFEMKDFIVLILNKLFLFKTILIVHDVSGFAKTDSKLLRYLMLNFLSSKIIVHNAFSKNKLKQEVNVRVLKKVYIIKHGNFIDNLSKRYSKDQAIKRLHLKLKTKYILFFGQIKKVKGLDILIEAFSKVKSTNIKLIIAGNPWKDTFDEYQRLIDKLDLKSKIITYIGYVDNYNRDLLFSSCELTVLPYLEVYQSGVLLSAMSNKTPVIASDLEPFKEIINDQNGIMFKSKDSYDLAQKIDYAINNPQEMINKSENAYKLISEEYNWKAIALEYYKILQ